MNYYASANATRFSEFCTSHFHIHALVRALRSFTTTDHVGEWIIFSLSWRKVNTETDTRYSPTIVMSVTNADWAWQRWSRAEIANEQRFLESKRGTLIALFWFPWIACNVNSLPDTKYQTAIKHITWLKSVNKAKSETMNSMTRNVDDTDIEVDYDEVSGVQRDNPTDTATAATIDSEMDDAASQCDILAKPAFTSRLLQNIPVRPRKGIPHMLNYCLFDPSKDFVNEKELKRKQKLMLNGGGGGEQLLNEKVYDKLDDIEEETECGNYVTVDPETPPSDAVTHDAGDVAHGPTFVRINKTASVNNFMSIGGNRPVAFKTATKIEKLFRQSSLPTVVSHRATEASSLQREIVAKQLPPKHLPLRMNNGNGVTPHPMANVGAFDALTHSVSSPQLNYAKDRRNKFHAPIEPIYMLYNSTHTVPNRSSIQSVAASAKKRYGRPLSSHSDADSGFLSPVTPCETNVAMQQPPSSSAATAASIASPLQQCDNFQRYIAVSNISCPRQGPHANDEDEVESINLSFLFPFGANANAFTDLHGLGEQLFGTGEIEEACDRFVQRLSWWNTLGWCHRSGDCMQSTWFE